MALQVVADRRYRNRDLALISINPKLNRIIINKKARELMIEKFEKEFEHVILLRDPEVKDSFWIRPCDSSEAGARQLNATSGTTRTVGCSLLLKELKWKPKETSSYPIIWDSENDAARVDLIGLEKGSKKKS